MKSLLLLILLSVLSYTGFAQLSDTLQSETDTTQEITGTTSPIAVIKFKGREPLIKSLLLPFSLTAYGFIALDNNRLKALDYHIKEEVWTEHPHQPMHFDDGLQYIPALGVYVLNCLNIPGKNNLVDATRQYLLSSLSMMIVVQSIKHITRLRRPDGFGGNTFPSGHESTAFVAAEFLHQEFKNRSPWISIAGYSMASVVGYMRIYNNRHWFKDIVSGAGIGMGITKLVYWAYPSIKRTFFSGKSLPQKLRPCY